MSVDIPQNPVGGKPMYQVTKEEDVNIFSGDGYLPQENFPPSPALSADPPTPAQPKPVPGGSPSSGPGIIPPCVGANHTVHVTNQEFIGGGGSPFEGQQKPLCDQKLVTVRGGQSTAPNFNLFTPVPLPTHFYGLTINDLGLSNDLRSIQYGEAQPLPGVPMGIYDFSGRLVDTVSTDFNGYYEALEPSTSTYNCPLPAGPCPGMYRFVGNDPGQPGHVNRDYNPRFRTIATNFQAWPGLYTVTDTAPTQVANVAVAPGSTHVNPVDCTPPATAPQILTTLINGPSFDPLYRTIIIRIPADHPVYSWDCLVSGCERWRTSTRDLCSVHNNEWRAERDCGVTKAEFLRAAQPLLLAENVEELACRICVDRPARNVSNRLCYRHQRHWYFHNNAYGSAARFDQWVADQEPLGSYGTCQVRVCPDLAEDPTGLCRRHVQRYRAQGCPGGASLPEGWWLTYEQQGLPIPVSYDDQGEFGRWCATDTPIPRPGQLNLLGLRPLLQAEIQWALFAHAQQQHAKWELPCGPGPH